MGPTLRVEPIAADHLRNLGMNPEEVMNRFWQVHSLVVRRGAPNSLRMFIRSVVEDEERPRQQVIL
jgi:ribosomal protein L16 Arg81 hydroxylase